MRLLPARRSILAAMLAALTIAAHGALAGDVTVQPNATWNGECSLVVDPSNPGHLVVAWMRLSGLAQVSIVSSVSTDRGVTWSTPVEFPHVNVAWTSADPTLAFGPGGILYLGYIDFDGRPRGTSGGADVVAHSLDGGATWSAVVTAESSAFEPDRPIDRPWLAVDRSGGALAGRVYLVSKSLSNTTDGQWHVWAVSSGDSGATWTPPRRVDLVVSGGPSAPSIGMPAVAADGALWVLYSSIDLTQATPTRLVAAVSRDTAQTFSPTTVNTLVAGAFFPADSLQRFTYALAADPHAAGSLVAVWTDARGGDPDIVASATHDGGGTWSAPLRVNDDPTGSGVVQDMPWAAFAPSGALGVGWRDRRLGGPGTAAGFDLYAAVSTDGGGTYSPNARLSAATSAAITETVGVDFLGVAMADTTVDAAWTSAVSSPLQVHVGTGAIPASVTGVGPFPGRLSAPAVRVTRASAGAIHVALGHAFGPADRLLLWSVGGRRVEVTAAREDGGAVLVPRGRLARGLYLVEWRSGVARAVAKAVVAD